MSLEILPSGASTSSTSLPGSYKALVAKHAGSCFREVAQVQEEVMRAPGEEEVVVKLTFAGINGGCETFRVRAEHVFAGNKGKQNFKLGAEAVGTVVAVGSKDAKLKVGQAVAVAGAGYMEFATVKASSCFPIRKATAEAAAVSLSGLTAACSLLCTGGLREGETVMVTAAAGGTGHFAVQIAKRKGCTVIATCGSSDKAQRLATLGADRVIDYRREDVGAVLESEFGGKIDVAYEGVGGLLREQVLANLSPTGRLLAVGYISEYPHTKHLHEQSHKAGGPAKHNWQLPSADKIMWDGLTLTNGQQVLYGQVWPKDPVKVLQTKKWLFEQVDSGAIEAWVDPKPFKGLEAVADAVDYMLSGQSTGKVVVDLR